MLGQMTESFGDAAKTITSIIAIRHSVCVWQCLATFGEVQQDLVTCGGNGQGNVWQQHWAMAVDGKSQKTIQMNLTSEFSIANQFPLATHKKESTNDRVMTKSLACARQPPNQICLALLNKQRLVQSPHTP